jgi:hypothetical protein
MSQTHLVWPDYSQAQFRAIAEALASAIAVAEHGMRRCQEAARFDPLDMMREEAEYYRHAARYLRWVNSHLQRERSKRMENLRHGGTDASRSG